MRVAFSTRSRRLLAGTSLLATGLLFTSTGLAAAGTYPSDTKPDILPALSGFNTLWQSSGVNDLHGTVLDSRTLQWNDRLASWINQNATKSQQFRALQNAAYLNSDGTGYDQSLTIADGLGSSLGAFYVKGRETGALPLASALINSSTGTTGAYISTGTAKATFSYPRPYLPGSASAPAATGDAAGCAPSVVNASSLSAIRAGKPWSDGAGGLKITRVPATVDTTHEFATSDVSLDAAYGQPGICTGGAFPSGHTTTAYEAGITLATLLPQLAPSILARASEAGNNRIVLGVHYPLDIIGGRINGEIALSARWGDPAFRAGVLQPAQAELTQYLTAQCQSVLHINTLAKCIAADQPYTDNPYGGKRIPGGSAQIVTNRRSALSVYTERLNYGFAPTTSWCQWASVPTGAESLLLSSFPTLTDSQRRQILAQTEGFAGNPLDTTAAHNDDSAVPASWQRLNLAAAMSATVKKLPGGNVLVLWTGGQPTVF
ncbi:PAP2 superfamily protein [Branchiibius hedensis]|uniref:PAP2 superfamily protein n=1 Tax=Branchiibius hedensis TaxID=672460 RepID=A0A2Y8ZX56_9MICO|nr:phosphatase PAP2 family protein [Branchiibius hedensis]PWJ27305.1 PAP2 superfamily protein [Branchiibius hedensis]SSA36116.1 PAP2 superfamily protein [Branchiibius hedensis]